MIDELFERSAERSSGRLRASASHARAQLRAGRTGGVKRPVPRASLQQRRTEVPARRLESVKEGDIALTPLPQADGCTKPRPVILLRRASPSGDWLVCGLSTQLHQEVAGLDATIEPSHSDFQRSGLNAPSLIRMGFLFVLSAHRLLGVLGSISPERHRHLLQRLGTIQLKEPGA